MVFCHFKWLRGNIYNMKSYIKLKFLNMHKVLLLFGVVLVFLDLFNSMFPRLPSTKELNGS